MLVESYHREFSLSHFLSDEFSPTSEKKETITYRGLLF